MPLQLRLAILRFTMLALVGIMLLSVRITLHRENPIRIFMEGRLATAKATLHGVLS